MCSGDECLGISTTKLDRACDEIGDREEDGERQSTGTHGWTVSCDGLQLIGAAVVYVGEAEKLTKAW